MDYQTFELLPNKTRVKWYDGSLGTLYVKDKEYRVDWDGRSTDTPYQHKSIVSHTWLCCVSVADVPQPNVYVPPPPGWAVTGEFRTPLPSDEGFIGIDDNVVIPTPECAHLLKPCGSRVILRRLPDGDRKEDEHER